MNYELRAGIRKGTCRLANASFVRTGYTSASIVSGAAMARNTFEQAAQARDEGEDQGRPHLVTSENCIIYYFLAESIGSPMSTILVLLTSLLRGRHGKVAFTFILDLPGTDAIRPAGASTTTVVVNILDVENPEAILYVKR